MPDTLLKIRLFGPRATLNEQSLAGARLRRGGFLLALLLVRPDHAATRAELRDALWPGYDPKDQTPDEYLATAITQLRHVLGAERLPRPGRWAPLRLNPVGVEVDLLEFRRDAAGDDPTLLANAVARYTGPLLETWTLDHHFGAVAAAEMLTERRTCEHQFLRACEALALAAMARKSRDEAVQLLLAAVAVAPFHRTPERVQMQRHAEQRDYLALVNTYAMLCGPNSDDRGAIADERRALVVQLRDAARRLSTDRAGPPPPPTDDAGPSTSERLSRVPHPLSPLIGRTEDLQKIHALLGTSRLLTLFGVGGIGKTRLAIAVAHDAETTDPAAVAFVDLAPLSDPNLLVTTVATELGVPPQAKSVSMETVAAFLQPRPFLLVLDNCEHLTDACAELAITLLHKCPHLRIVATSRRPLGVAAEATWSVPPLPVPTSDPADSRRATAAYPSVELFIARTSNSRPGLVLADGDYEVVATICRRLDGIPLAIVLAAARVGVLSIQEIAESLDDRFSLLASKARFSRSEHQSLRKTLEWSIEHLSDATRHLFERLSVFAGGFTRQGAETVSDQGGNPTGATSMVESIQELIACALLLSEDCSGEIRYRMLESVRSFGAEQLGERGEEEIARDLHLAYFAWLAEDAEREMMGKERASGISRLERERDNLRAALAWATKSATPPRRVVLGLRLASALSRFWALRGRVSEGRGWLTALLNIQLAAANSESTQTRVKALHEAARLAKADGRPDEARALCIEAVKLSRDHGTEQDLATALCVQARMGGASSRPAEVASLLEEAVELQRRGDDRSGLALSRFSLANVFSQTHEGSKAEALYAECLAIRREIGDESGRATVLRHLGLHCSKHDLREAERHLRESLEICNRLVHRDGAAYSLLHLGRLARRQGRLDEARTHFETMRQLREALGDRTGLAGAHRCLGTVAHDRGDLDEARCCFERSRAIASEIGNHWLGALALYGLSRCETDPAAAEALRARAVAAYLPAREGIVLALLDRGAIALSDGEATAAVRWLGAALSVRAAIAISSLSHPLPSPSDCPIQHLLDEARPHLDEPTFEAAFAEGRALSVENAVLELLSEE